MGCLEGGVGGLRRWKWVGLALAFSAAAAGSADACSCGDGGGPPGCGRAALRATLFVGTVVGISTVEQTGPPFRGTSKRVRFAVEQSLQGEQQVGEEITVATGANKDDCGIAFVVGRRYLVDAGIYQGSLYAGLCGSTMMLTTGGQIPALTGHVFLAKQPDPASPDGHVYDEIFDDPDSGDAAYPKYDSMAHIPVTVKDVRTGEKRSTVTDDDGIYNFLSLRPDTYTFSLKLPPQRMVEALGDGSEATVKVPDSGGVWATCQQDMRVVPTGKIVGAVIDPGGLRVPDGYLTLYSVTSRGVLRQIAWDAFDGNGEFEFSGLWDGAYVLKFVKLIVQEHRRKELYYPGVGAPEKAGKIEVRNGGTSKRVVFKPPKDF